MRLESTSSICSCVLSSYLVSVLVLVVSRLHCIYCVNPCSILYGNLSSQHSKPKKQTRAHTSKKKTHSRNGYNVRYVYRHKKRRYMPLFCTFWRSFWRIVWGNSARYVRIYPFKFFYLIFAIISDNDFARLVVCLAQLELSISELAKLYSPLLICFRVFLNLEVPL